jgi:hypothetical protein
MLDLVLVGEEEDHLDLDHLVEIVLLVLPIEIHLAPHGVFLVAEASVQVLPVDLQMDSNIECDMVFHVNPLQ